MKVIAAAMLCLAGLSLAAEPELAPNAPLDRPGAAPAAELEQAIAPLVAQARASYPQAKERFLRGLPKGEIFFVTTRLYDLSGHVEQVFVRVLRIDDSQVFGRIASPIMRVRGFRNGDALQVSESAIIDWVIAKPDGSEEGNVVGKFLDTYQPK